VKLIPSPDITDSKDAVLTIQEGVKAELEITVIRTAVKIKKGRYDLSKRDRKNKRDIFIRHTPATRF